MIQQTKPFNQKLHDENDGPAREVVIQTFLELWGIVLVNNPDKYGVDLLAYRAGAFQGGVEIEVKHNWTGHRFPFGAVHFPGRKQKFLDFRRPVIFVMVNRELSHLMWFHSKHLIEGKRVTKRTRLTDFEETFIEVDAGLGVKVACSGFAS